MINGKESFVLKECVTCYACDEYCPYNSHPFDMFTELQEKYKSLDIAPTTLETTINRFKLILQFSELLRHSLALPQN